MSMTIHEILIHSWGIIKYVILPMGQLGIEPQESRKKIAFHVVSRVRPFSTNFISRINGEVTNSSEVCYQSMILSTMFSDLRSMFQMGWETNVYILFEHADKNVQRSVRLPMCTWTGFRDLYFHFTFIKYFVFCD